MRQRDEAKKRRRKPLTPKGRSASKTPRRNNFSPASGEKDVADLSRELNEAFEQQAATADILNIISNSPSDTQPVFEAIVQSVLKLFPDALISLALRYGDRIDAAAVAARDPERAEAWRRTISRTPLSREYMHGAALLDCRIVDVPDAKSAPAEFAAGARNFLTSGNRAITITPMMRQNEAIGLLTVVRRTPGTLSDKQLSLFRTFANQAVIAIENTRLLNELRESLQRQTATADVLSVISSSPGELAPVFQAMLENATRVCGSNFGTLYLREGEAFRAVSMHGATPDYLRSRLGQLVHPGPGTGLGRAVRTKQAVHIADVTAEPAYRERDPMRVAAADLGGVRTMLNVPMLKEGEVVGGIAIYRTEVRPFTEKQIELVKNFASQAVIAIENTRLLNELRQRTDDLSESLEQQTATSGILSVISNSLSDTQPVFEAIVESGLRLFPGAMVIVALADRDKVKAAAVAAPDPVGVEAMRRRFPFPLTREYMHSTAILDRRIVDVPDVENAPAELAAGARNFLASGYRAVTIMPMIRGDAAIGALSVARG